MSPHGHHAHGHHHSRHRTRHIRRRVVLAVIVAVIVVVGALVTVRLTASPPAPTFAMAVPASTTAPGTAPTLPWPSAGQSAVSIPALGYASQSGTESPVPIASLTKMTTAVVVLRDHPIPSGSDGPMITLTAADVARDATDVDSDQSTVPVTAGEQLSERQMLEALLIRSANNIAYALAVWDAGSEAAFVVKMNTLAASLGMSNTHYVDASGYLPQTQSSSADCLRVAAVGMAIPTFAEIVAMPSVTLPVLGTMPNYVTLVGTDGVIGIKSGFTSAAGGCMVLATDKVVGGQTVLVLAAVTGQAFPNVTYPLVMAGNVAQGLLNAAGAAVVSVPVATSGQVVGAASVTWDGSGHGVPVVAAGGATVAAVPGQTIAATAQPEAIPVGAHKGRSVGTVTYSLGSQHPSVPIRLGGPVTEPSWMWRLLHG